MKQNNLCSRKTWKGQSSDLNSVWFLITLLHLRVIFVHKVLLEYLLHARCVRCPGEVGMNVTQGPTLLEPVFSREERY